MLLDLPEEYAIPVYEEWAKLIKQWEKKFFIPPQCMDRRSSVISLGSSISFTEADLDRAMEGILADLFRMAEDERGGPKIDCDRQAKALVTNGTVKQLVVERHFHDLYQIAKRRASAEARWKREEAQTGKRVRILEEEQDAKAARQTNHELSGWYGGCYHGFLPYGRSMTPIVPQSSASPSGQAPAKATSSEPIMFDFPYLRGVRGLYPNPVRRVPVQANAPPAPLQDPNTAPSHGQGSLRN